MSSNLLFFLPRRFFFSSPSAKPGSRPPSAGRSPGAPGTAAPLTNLPKKVGAVPLALSPTPWAPLRARGDGEGERNGHQRALPSSGCPSALSPSRPTSASTTGTFFTRVLDLRCRTMKPPIPEEQKGGGSRQGLAGGGACQGKAAPRSTHRADTASASSSCSPPGPPAPSLSPRQPRYRGRGWPEPPA